MARKLSEIVNFPDIEKPSSLEATVLAITEAEKPVAETPSTPAAAIPRKRDRTPLDRTTQILVTMRRLLAKLRGQERKAVLDAVVAMEAFPLVDAHGEKP